MLKVLYILSSTSTQGGASKSFMVMLNRLRTMGVEGTIVLPSTQGLYKELQAQGVAVRAYTYRMAVYPPCNSIKDCLLWFPRLCGRLIVNHRATLQVEQLCQQIHPDIIHTNVSVIDIGFRAAQHLHIPHIWHIREYGDLDFHLYHYPTRSYQLRCYQKDLSYTICITRDIQKHNMLTNNSCSRVIYNGILSTHITAYSKPKEPFFLFAGHIEPAKGVYELLQAYTQYTQIAPKIYPLYIAGAVCNKNYKTRLQGLIQTYHLEEYIHFLGEINDIFTWEQSATAVIIPSLNEGFGRVMPESMWAKTLVIAHNTAGTKEQLDNGVQLTGSEIALRYNTEGELVRHLVCVSDSPVEEYMPMIERAYTTVSHLYTTEQNAQHIMQFYKYILQK